jgi:hypothetical protein
VSSTLSFGCSARFFENPALHYLCRLKDLEDVSPRQFFEEYYVLNIKGKPAKGDMPFINTPFFNHPSAKKGNDGMLGACRQGVRQHEERKDIKMSQWTFPDTA